MFGEYYEVSEGNEDVDDSGWGATDPTMPKDKDEADKAGPSLALDLKLRDVASMAVLSGGAIGGTAKSSAASAVISLVIRRRVSSLYTLKAADHPQVQLMFPQLSLLDLVPRDHDKETFLPPRVLAGLLPEILLQSHSFWRYERLPSLVVGYPRVSDDAGEEWLGEWRSVPIYLRLFQNHSGSLSGCAYYVTRENELRWLVNLLYAAPQSVEQSIANLVTRLDNLSHILCWASSSSPTSMTLIDLPRLRLRFQPQALDATHLQLRSLDYAGMSISDLRPPLLERHMAGMPFSLVLQDEGNTLHILVANFGVRRPRVRSLPFTTALVPRRTDTWVKNVSIFHPRESVRPHW